MTSRRQEGARLPHPMTPRAHAKRALVTAVASAAGTVAIALAATASLAAPSPAPAPAPSPAPVATTASGETVVDLLANRWRWHLYDRGLVIPLASEGFRKYSLEYRNPWGDVATTAGHPGRALPGRHAELRFPGPESASPAMVLVRVYAPSGSVRLSVHVGKKTVKNTTLATGWQQVRVDAPAGALAPGENTLELTVSDKRALFHSVEVVPGAPSGTIEATWPALSPVVVGGGGGGGAARRPRGSAASGAWPCTKRFRRRRRCV